jgi:hypothetical protein
VPSGLYIINLVQGFCSCILKTCPAIKTSLLWSFSLHLVRYIVTWMARALLGNGPENTPRLNTHKATKEQSPFLDNDL